jgi:hypothetical protein
MSQPLQQISSYVKALTEQPQSLNQWSDDLGVIDQNLMNTPLNPMIFERVQQPPMYQVAVIQ